MHASGFSAYAQLNTKWPHVVHLPSLVTLFLAHPTFLEGEWLFISHSPPHCSQNHLYPSGDLPLPIPSKLQQISVSVSLSPHWQLFTFLPAAALPSTLEGNAGEGLGQLSAPRAEGHKGEWE